MMSRTVLIVLFLHSTLFAYMDSDIDGVEDQYDKCPQTSLSDLVDMDGCTIEKTDHNMHYDLIFGTELSQMNYTSQEQSDTINTYTQANIYLDQWRFELAASRYSSTSSDYTSSGWNDTYLNLYFNSTPTEKLRIEISAGVAFPTYVTGYGNEAIDYSAGINFEYKVNSKFYLFGSDTYTWIRDKNSEEASYQNSNGFQIGVGTKPTPSTSLNLFYNDTQSIYTDVNAIQSLGASGKVYLNPHWLIGTTYMYGLSDSASSHTFSLELGYSF